MAAPAAVRLANEALAHHRAGRLDRAAALYAKALAIEPGHFESLQLAGALALQRGFNEEAAGLLGRALALRPANPDCLVRMGAACAALGRLEEAESCARRAIAIVPQSSDAARLLGGVLVRAGKIDAAIAAFRALTNAKPNDADAWVALASAELQRGWPAVACAACERALKVNPAHATARFVLGQAQLQGHEVGAALASFSAQVAHRPQHHLARSFRLFALNYEAGISREQLFAEHREFGRAVAPARSSALRPARVEGRRVRLAFLSPDLRRHAVATFLEPLVEHIDRKRFEIFLYHDHFRVDEVSRRLQARADRWCNFVGHADSAVAAVVRADAPDVLVDLAGHTHHNRMALLAQRLAPVQVNYLGYANTTGLDAMDFRFTDSVSDPEGETDALHTERLVRFAPVAWAYAPPADAPDVSPPPSAAGAPFTFGCFNNLSKVNAATLALWRRVLDAVPGSRLLIKGLRLDEARMRARLDAAGIPAERAVLLTPVASTREHLAAYSQVDLALDPHPYNGTTTTCEALWMGVPVITLRGDRHASRVGTSLVTVVGHADWSAGSEDEYVARAAALASDRVTLVAARAGLRARMAASPLLDHAGQAARFAAAIEQCIERVGKNSSGGSP
ncbi:MAG TPA: tetratricopeptide repeat protein [Opitutaceae bacterium]|nr:tetratricopeptide repeat protein [Opitutaceae bacterium]